MYEKFKELKDLISYTEVDLKKFGDKNNKSAGIRARHNLTKIIKLAIAVRKEVLETRKKSEIKND